MIFQSIFNYNWDILGTSSGREKRGQARGKEHKA
jgi:hypothetical protein